jgi:hypothetical protein
MFSRIVSDYPLSKRADDAKKRLEEMEKPIPKVNQAALDREKYDLANYHRPSIFKRSLGMFESGPDVSHAAKSGAPTMTDPKRTFPASIPVVANSENGSAPAAGTGTAEVTASTVGPNSALDKNPDARTTATGSAPAAQPASNQPLPTNRDAELRKYREKQAKKQEKVAKKKKKKEDSGAPAVQPATDQPPVAATPAPSANTASSPQQ